MYKFNSFCINDYYFIFQKKKKSQIIKKQLFGLIGTDVHREQPDSQDYACSWFHVSRKNNLHKHLINYKKQFFTLW